MPRNSEEKAIVVSLLVLGAIIAGAPLALLVAAVWKTGFGFNRSTLVLVCSAVALIGVFWLWVRSGAVVIPSEPDPELEKAKSLGFWGFLKWDTKRELPYMLFGLSLWVVGVLLAIAYVKYIEPLLK